MAKAVINPGVCGFVATVEATMEGKVCHINIQSECKAIQKMAAEIGQVSPFEEISFRKATPSILENGAKYCTHAACPVPVGIIKAVEVAAGLALPREVNIELSK